MNTPQPLSIGVVAVVICLLVTGCSTLEPQNENETEAGNTALFKNSVKPLFERRCVWCHSQNNAQGGLNFQDRDGLLTSNRNFIVPDSSERSLIYRAVTLRSAHPKVMPGDGWGISQEHEQSLRRWIDGGASWPEGRAGQIKRKPYRVEIDDL